MGINKFVAESFIIPDKERKKKKTKRLDDKALTNLTACGEQNVVATDESTKVFHQKSQNKKIVFDSEKIEQKSQCNKKVSKNKDNTKKLLPK